MSEAVLLLDDDATMLGILEGVLHASGYRCLTAQHANAALALIREHPEIAVVVSDIMMPGISGLEFVDRLNALGLKNAPPRVLLLTSQPTLEGAVDALRLGVRDFLAKPIRPVELIEAVKRVMAQAREDRSVAAARSPYVEQLMRQADELASRLRTLAISAVDTPDSVPLASTPSEVAPPKADAVQVPGAQPVREPSGQVKLAVLETIEQLRRLRTRYRDHGLDDVAWDLLLELLRAERLRQRLSVSGLAISITGVSATTSLRRINELTARQYMERHADPDDARRDFVTLTSKSHLLLSEYLAQANVYVSALTA